jgi:hypothetical protein
MTSRDFGFTTLRSAVAYRRNNTLVPPNNVYVTSTNGAAIFSDTLTISTINVSTATISTLTVSTINGGGGGGVILITAGTNISTTGTASNPTINVNINSTLDMAGFDIINVPNITNAGGNITINANNGNGDVNITGSTLFNGSINVASTFYDNNVFSGTSGQVLTAGTGGQVIWSTISGGGGGGSVNSVIAGTNISTSGTATDPIINVNINSTLEMNGNNIHSSGALGITSDASLNLDGTSTNMVSSDGGILLQTNGATKKITLDIGEGLFDVVATDIRLYGLSTLQTTKMVYIAEGTGYLSVGDLPSSVNSVTAGTNISITGTASTPIINVDINSTLLMNGFPIYDYSTITIASGSTINLSTASTSIVLNEASTNITITSITGPINLTGNPVVIKNVTPVLQFDDTTTSTNITFYNNGSAFGDTALITNAGELGVYNETGGQSMRIGTSTIGGFPVSYIMGLSTTTLFIGENGASSFSNITLGSTSISLKLDKRLDTDFNSTAANIELFGTGEIDIISYYSSINVTASTGVNVTADTGGINLTSPIITMSTLNTAFTNKILYYNTTDGAVTYDDAPPGTTGVVSVSSGINISTTGTAINPIINVNINSTLDMNLQDITNANQILLKSNSARVLFSDALNVVRGSLDYNPASNKIKLDSEGELTVTTVAGDLDVTANGGFLTVLNSGNRITIQTDVDGLGNSGNIELTANGTGAISLTTGSTVEITGGNLDLDTNDLINGGNLGAESMVLTSDLAKAEFKNGLGVLKGSMGYNVGTDFMDLTGSAGFEINTTAGALNMTANGGKINMITNGENIELYGNTTGGFFADVIIGSADGDLDLEIGGNILMNAGTTGGNITVNAYADFNMYSQQITLSTLNNLNMYVGSTINMTGGTTLISSTYLLLTINNTPYKIALLT